MFTVSKNIDASPGMFLCPACILPFPEHFSDVFHSFRRQKSQKFIPYNIETLYMYRGSMLEFLVRYIIFMLCIVNYHC